VTDIRLPDDLPELTSLQLVDYRRQQSEELRAAFSYLTHDDQVSRATFSLRLLPVNLARRAGSPDLQRLFDSLIILSLINLTSAILLAGRLRLASNPMVPIPAEFMPQAAGCGALLLINLVLWWFGLGVLRGVARFRARLLVIIAAASLPIFALIQWSVILVAQAGSIVPQTGLTAIAPNERPVGVIVIAYVLVLSRLVRALSNEYLLVRTGIPVLGMRRLRPQWRLILIIPIFILVIMALSLLMQN
jgi:hypothetical protein